jgi:hypothetical protein
MPTKLPPPPDFDKFDTAAKDNEHYAQRKMVSEAIGDLIVHWANNESLLVYLLALLLEADNQTAQITFFSLNTTQGRLQLMERLALFKLRDPIRTQTLKYLKGFRAFTNKRNEFAHSMYMYTSDARVEATFNVRFNSDFDGSQIGEIKQFDQARYNEVRHSTRMLLKFNRDMHAFLPAVEQHIRDWREAQLGTPGPAHPEQSSQTPPKTEKP